MKCKPGQRVESGTKELTPLLVPSDVRKAIEEGRELHYVLMDGNHWVYFPVRVNGALKTFPRYPNRWELPVVYGKSDCFTVSNDIDRKQSISHTARYIAVEKVK